MHLLEKLVSRGILTRDQQCETPGRERGGIFISRCGTREFESRDRELDFSFLARGGKRSSQSEQRCHLKEPDFEKFDASEVLRNHGGGGGGVLKNSDGMKWREDFR